MKKDQLLKEKEMILKEISELRMDLKIANDKVTNAGKSIPFYKVEGPPLVLSAIFGFIITNIPLFSDKKNGLGIMFLLFIIGLYITTKKSQKKIKENKDSYINDRLAIQKDIVEKGKRLAQIESELKAIEN